MQRHGEERKKESEAILIKRPVGTWGGSSPPITSACRGATVFRGRTKIIMRLLLPNARGELNDSGYCINIDWQVVKRAVQGEGHAVGVCIYPVYVYSGRQSMG